MRFPRALHAARVEVVLDEAVDRVDRRVLVFDPGDVVRHAVRRRRRFHRSESTLRARGASAVARTAAPPAGDARSRRSGRRSARRRGRLPPISRPSRLTRRELRPYRSSNPSRSAMVTLSYRLLALARRMSAPPAGVLFVTKRIDRRIEERSAQALDHRRHRLAGPRGKRRAVALRRFRRRPAGHLAGTSARTCATSCCCADPS